ncbi:hypothetical protein KY290_038356 [Solanum tuberosum]|uniref:Ubiquitin-like protease family profile domain-containing protein n=1 Tax=Solanum tuberosum TaxID=4113 RepID=A0ABQ7TZX2_SOLTU|nr:hypothetical protein KY290_038356 [Solanum tuberosum]
MNCLKFGPTYNSNFIEDLVLSIKDQGIELFKDTIFAPYLNIPKCNYQGQITKCLYLLEIEQGNLANEVHIRHAKGNVLIFSITDFAIITSLRCKGNVKDFNYPASKTSRLVQRYFPSPNYNVNKGRLVDRFMQGGWDNNDDALQMSILFFIHTFLYSQLGDAPIPIEDFFMVEDGSYEEYPWGQVAFTKLMKSFRQEYTPTKKMYRLNGLPYALNVWIYECASVLNNEIAVKEGNGIPRMCNWQVVAPKPKFEMFMDTIFTEIDCSNIQPTPEEIRSLDLPDNSHVPSNRPDSPIVNNEEVQPKEVPGFEDFSSKPPDQLLRRSTRSFQSPSSEPKQADNVSGVPHNTFSGRTTIDSAGMEDLKMYMKGYVDNKFGALENKIGALEELIKNNQSELLKAVGAKDNKTEKDIGGVSSSHMMDDSVEKGVVDSQPKSDKFDQQTISPIQMDFATDYDVVKPAVDVEKEKVSDHTVQKKYDTSIKEQVMQDSSVLLPTTLYNDPSDDGADTIQQEFEKHASNSAVVNTSDSTTSASISSGTELAVDALVYGLPNQPINVKPLSVLHLTEGDDFLSDSQIPTQLLGDEHAPNTNTKTPAPRNRMPSMVLQSPYVNSFGSSDKGKEKIDDDIRPYTPFEDCRITYQLSSGLMQEFLEWIQKGLLRTHAKKKPFEDKYRGKFALFGFDHMDFVVACPADKNWFYTMSYPMKCWTDQHIDVIFYYLRKKSKLRSMNQYLYTTVNCLFKSYIDIVYKRYHCSPADDTFSTQEHIDRGVMVSAYERSITDIISGFSIPAALPWHLVDEVYIPVNCGEDFHWVLAVVVLKERLIRVYDSSMVSRKKVYAKEIKKLSIMLPNYLHDSGFFDKTGRTDWASMEAYKDKETGELLGPQHSFEVEYVQDIMQQQSDSLDCGMYVAAFAEYLSDEISIPSISFRSDYLRNRYATLLWKYGMDKFKAGYVSDNDDPTRPKSFYTIPAECGLINIE